MEPGSEQRSQKSRILSYRAVLNYLESSVVWDELRVRSNMGYIK
jgi:hypothetical protein